MKILEDQSLQFQSVGGERVLQTQQFHENEKTKQILFIPLLAEQGTPVRGLIIIVQYT